MTDYDFDRMCENNAAFKDADNVISAIRDYIKRMNMIANDAFTRFAEVAEEIATGRITGQNDIEWQLDHLLDYCYDATCHKLYERILDSIEDKYPMTAAYYKAAYNSMWVDNLPDELEAAEEILRANPTRLANHLRLDAQLRGLSEYGDDMLQTEVDAVRQAMEKHTEQENENEPK